MRPASGSRLRFPAEQTGRDGVLLRRVGGTKTRPSSKSATRFRARPEIALQARQANPEANSVATRHDLHSTDSAVRSRLRRRRLPNCAESMSKCALPTNPRATSRCRNRASKSYLRSASLEGVNGCDRCREFCRFRTRARFPRSDRLRAADRDDNSGFPRRFLARRSSPVVRPNRSRISIRPLPARWHPEQFDRIAVAQRNIRRSRRQFTRDVDFARWLLLRRFRASIRSRAATPRRIIPGSTPRSKR